MSWLRIANQEACQYQSRDAGRHLYFQNKGSQDTSNKVRHHFRLIKQSWHEDYKTRDDLQGGIKVRRDPIKPFRFGGNMKCSVPWNCFKAFSFWLSSVPVYSLANYVQQAQFMERWVIKLYVISQVIIWMKDATVGVNVIIKLLVSLKELYSKQVNVQNC